MTLAMIVNSQSLESQRGGIEQSSIKQKRENNDIYFYKMRPRWETCRAYVAIMKVRCATKEEEATPGKMHAERLEALNGGVMGCCIILSQPFRHVIVKRKLFELDVM